MKSFEIFENKQSLLHIFYKIVHKYKDEFDSLNSILEFNDIYITLISKNASLFSNLEKEFPNIIIKHKFNDNQLLQYNACYDFIMLKDTEENKITNNTFKMIYTKYIDSVDDIYKIDDTGFIVLTNEIEIVADILNEISELFNYNYIGNRHIFTLK